jgi:hypothetical protein
VFSPGGFTADKSVELFVMSVIGGVGSISGAVLGAVYVVGLPLLPGLREIEFVEFLTTGLGLLVLLMVLPGGLAEGAYRVRDALLRRVADKHGIHVPSLVADSLQGDEHVEVPGGTVQIHERPADAGPDEVVVQEPTPSANGHRPAQPVGGAR